MTDGPFHPAFDRALNQVAIPASLAARLRAIASLDDVELDFRLGAVELPPRLVDRLCEVVTDTRLDDRLQGVEPPTGVLPRLRNIPRLRRRSPWRQGVLAASLTILIGAGIGALLGSVADSFRAIEPPSATWIVVDGGPLDIYCPSEPAVAIVPAASDDARQAAGVWSDETMRLLTTFDRPSLGPAGQLAQDLGKAWNPWDNWLLARWGVLGYAPAAHEALPELAVWTPPAAQGMPAPLTRGYDREFLYSRGVQPPMLTAFDPSAVRVDVPLATSTASVDRVRQFAATQRPPPADSIQVEDFVAAVQGPVEAVADPGRLTIRTAGGPSIFNPSNAKLLQISVQAGRCAAVPAHLVLAIDTSAGMAHDGALDWVRGAVAAATAQMGPHDRLSVILFGREATEVVREVRREDRSELTQLAAMLEHVRGDGGANLGAALQQGLALAIEARAARDLPSRLVLVTASEPALLDGDARHVRQMFAEAAKRDVRVAICELARGEASDEASAAAWADLASGTPCTVQPVRGTDALRWALIEAWTADAAVAAVQIAVRVDFNPRAVAAYRVVGQESVSFGGLLTCAAESSLRAGQSGTALFETWLYANDEDDVATVRVQWVDPATGETRNTSPQRVSRLQFATAFEGAAVSLQAATIAAEAAEVLKQAYTFRLIAPDRYAYEPKSASLEHVRARARAANPILTDQPQFRQFVTLIETLADQAGERSVAASRSGTRGITGDQWREYGLK